MGCTEFVNIVPLLVPIGYSVLSWRPRVEEALGCVRVTIANVSESSLRLACPAPVSDTLPALAAAGTHRIPHGAVVAEGIGKVRAASGLVDDGDADVRIEIGKVDDVRTTAERAEGRRADRDLC